MMFMYRLITAGYESHSEKTYLSDTFYTEQELEDIVVEAYKASCEHYIYSNNKHMCFSLSFNPEDRLFDYYDGDFTDKYLEDKYELVRLSNYTAQVFIDITHDSHTQEILNKMDTALNDIPIDESCWDNDCDIQDNNDDFDKKWYRQKCLVYNRKQSRIKEHTCNNCFYTECNYADCEDKPNPCSQWKWDGESS